MIYSGMILSAPLESLEATGLSVSMRTRQVAGAALFTKPAQNASAGITTFISPPIGEQSTLRIMENGFGSNSVVVMNNEWPTLRL